MKTDTNAPEDAALTQPSATPDSEGLLPGDTYVEGPYVVFTAQYHLRRGFCCNSDCRHCPYRGD